MKYIIGNWKSNKNSKQAREWIEQFAKLYKYSENVKVILSPSLSHTVEIKQYVSKKNIQISLAAQNISPYKQGPYTGEISAEQLADLVEYVIIGHSERRNYFNENDNLLEQKVQRALENNILPIYCIRSDSEFIPSSVKIIAYEPVEAIGSGQPQDPAVADAVIQKIKTNCENVKIGIYGGSVNVKNADLFLKAFNIDGVLPGRASLDAYEFTKIIQKASQIQA